MKKIISVAISMLILFSAIPSFAASTPSAWALSEVRSAISEGIVPESLQDNYQNAITRSEFCDMIMAVYAKLGKTVADSIASPFTDTNSENVAKASSLGIVLGIGDGLFAPDKLITRQEICAMYTRCVKAAFPDIKISTDLPNTFPDIETIDSWAINDVKYINMLEVMLGDEENRINPHNNTTREQAILLSHRLIKAFSGDLSDFLAMMGFTTSANNSVNMLNGAFAVSYTGGPLYLSDKTGIYTIDGGERSSVTTEEASTIYMQKNEKYFIKASDSLIYKVTSFEPKKLSELTAENIIPIAGYIYFTSPGRDGLYRVKAEGGDTELYIEGKISNPISSGKYIYYASDDGIYTYDTTTSETAKIYDGTVYSLSLSNSHIYFKDAAGYLYGADTDGKNVKRISRESVKLYSVYSSDAVCYTTDNGLFKTNYTSSFVIKMSNDTFENINTYNNYIFTKGTDGSIYRIKSDYSEFTKLN